MEQLNEEKHWVDELGFCWGWKNLVVRTRNEEIKIQVASIYEGLGHYVLKHWIPHKQTYEIKYISG